MFAHAHPVVEMDRSDLKRVLYTPMYAIHICVTHICKILDVLIKTPIIAPAVGFYVGFFCATILQLSLCSIL